jgi:hypothetical protein
MALDVHDVSILRGSSPLAAPDRLSVLLQKQIANAAGSAAGAAVQIPITGLELPASYAVFVSTSQDATYYISGRTQSGFTINLSPRLAASTLVVGTLDLLVVA